MTDRRREPLFQAGSPAYHRIMQRMEERDEALSDRIEAAFHRIDSRLDAIERDGQTDRRQLANDIEELRRDVGELRDAVPLSAAKVVADVVAQAPASVLSAIPASWHRTAWGRAVLIAGGFTTLMIAADNVPDAARGWDNLWRYLRNEPPPVVRPAPPRAEMGL